MMKWLGLLLVVCSGGGIGFLYAMRLRQERTNLERLCQMLREIAVQIAFRSLTVQELLEQLCRETAYAAFQFPVTVLSGMEQGLPLAEAWAAGIRQDKAVPNRQRNCCYRWGKNWEPATWTDRRQRWHSIACSWSPMRRKPEKNVCSGSGCIAVWGCWEDCWRRYCFVERECGNGDRSHF